ncbi:MAG: prephenate dehydrogenase [Acidithiobacillus sp.]|uniref:prephenate dehydrogenase n=1 Tax=Acidithiobacillus sp. TaxID=1872118 RepID=UPI003D02AAC0
MSTSWPFRTVAVLGLGLMGGSLALALRRSGYAGVLLGAGGSPEDLRLAAAARYPAADGTAPVFDRCSDDPAQLPWATVDLVVLATPPAALPEMFRRLREWIPATTVVTDLASVKGEIVATGAALLGRRYLSAHPLVGGERHGFAAATGDLYAEALVLLTPGAAGADERALGLVPFWEGLGCRVRTMSPAEHDDALAATSHLPHLLAYAFMASLGDSDALRDLGGSGLRDFSRIAESDPALWTDILLHNREAVRRRLQALRHTLDDLDAALAEARAPALEEVLARARSRRQQFRFPPRT